MDRRRFNLCLAAACGAVCMPGLAWAQGAPVEGKDYVRLAQPVPMPSSGKVEVVEFFGYWCPHCNSFEPAIDAWSRKLPADVSFRRVPVAFSAPQEPYAKIYLALEALGQLDALHRKVFTAIHVQRQRLEKDAEITAFVTANGLDATKFMDTYKGFTVASKFKQARQLADAYKIDGVPTIGIHGRFFTSPSLVGSGEQALRVTDYLIQRAKQS
ncbi:MAG TPA: thiol:disulfide interchange protein DsbA/DsbL [Burkholderiaceae bacterium]|nr:thiol:disulfide interchange protein DsbA/DsbL [Burkholderiaceae bacterium]